MAARREIPQNDLVEYAIITPETTFLEFLRSYTPLAPGHHRVYQALDVAIDLPSPSSPASTHTMPHARVQALSKRVGRQGVRFQRQLGMLDDEIQDILDLILPTARVPSRVVDLVNEGRFDWTVDYYDEASQSANLDREVFTVINGVLRRAPPGLLKPQAVPVFPGARMPLWGVLESATFTGAPNAGFGLADGGGAGERGFYHVAIENKVPAVLLPGRGTQIPSLLQLEQWADAKHVMTCDTVAGNADEARGTVFELVRQILETCATRCPKLYILSSYTHYVVMRVTPPSAANPQTTITLSTRFARHCSGVTLSSEGTPVFDVRKVNLPIILLALSIKDANKPSRDWHRDVVWPSAQEVAAFGGGPGRQGKSAQLMPGIDDIVDKGGSSSDAGAASSSRHRRRPMVHPYDGQPDEVGYLIVNAPLGLSSTEPDQQYPLHGYQLQNNASFSPVPVHSGSSYDVSSDDSMWSNYSVDSAASSVIQGRSASPDAMDRSAKDAEKSLSAHSLPLSSSAVQALPASSSSARSSPARLEFQSFLAKGRLGDVYLGEYRCGSISAKVAIKVVIPEALYSRKRHFKGYDQFTSGEARQRILHEWDLYSGCLAPLQGKVIPKCYGLWSGQLGSPFAPWEKPTFDQGEILLLITEYLPREMPEGELHSDDKKAIEDLHRRLAEHGVLHGDVESRHWRAGPDGWRLIDLEGAMTIREVAVRWEWEDWRQGWKRSVDEQLKFVRSLMG